MVAHEFRLDTAGVGDIINVVSRSSRRRVFVTPLWKREARGDFFLPFAPLSKRIVPLLRKTLFTPHQIPLNPPFFKRGIGSR